MARRLPDRSRRPPSASRGVLVLPADLMFNRPEYGWASSVAFHAAQRQWFVEHGIDPGDWNALHPIFDASRRAHARRVGELAALDRARRRAEGDDSNGPA